MAKKKVENIVIKDEELTPTTLGIYSNKTKNPIGLIFIIAIFIAIVIFMPQIQSYVGKYLGNDDEIVTPTNNPGNDDNGGGDDIIDDDEDKKYDVSVGTVEGKGYTLTNVSLSGTTLSFTFTNTNNSSFDLSNYYIELYSSEGTFVQRVKVSDETIPASSSKEYSYNVTTGISQFSFVKKTVDDYPQVTLNYNENLEATLVCKLGTNIYNYLFIDDQLSRITYTYSLTNTGNNNFFTVSQEYQRKANANIMVDGVTSTYSETLNEFYYTLNVDLAKADITKLSDDNLFKSKTEPKVVKFILDAKGYSCSQN